MDEPLLALPWGSSVAVRLDCGGPHLHGKRPGTLRPSVPEEARHELTPGNDRHAERPKGPWAVASVVEGFEICDIIPISDTSEWVSLGDEAMTLFSGLGTDVHFSGDETGLKWEDYLFEMQNVVEWRMVMSRGQGERSQMHAMSLLLSMCSGMTNRVLIDDGAKWILQGSEQEQRDRTAGVKALYSMLASTASGRAKELLKQGLSDRNGMIAFGRIRERFGKTAGVAKLSDVF